VIDINEYAPECDCFKSNPSKEPYVGPYYTQLGVGKDLVELRKVLEGRTGVTGAAIRIEKANYCPLEGKTTLGCPIAKYILRRGSKEELFCAIVKHR